MTYYSSGVNGKNQAKKKKKSRVHCNEEAVRSSEEVVSHGEEVHCGEEVHRGEEFRHGEEEDE